MPEEHEFWDSCVRSATADADLEGWRLVWLQFQNTECLVSEGLMLSAEDLKYLLTLCE